MTITRVKLFNIGFLGWLLGSLAPYLISGETWGMVWILVNYPAAVLTKKWDLMEWHYPYLFVGVTTLLNATLVGLCVCAVGGLFIRKAKPKSPEVLERPQ